MTRLRAALAVRRGAGLGRWNKTCPVAIASPLHSKIVQIQYTHTKDESISLLKLVIAQVSMHDAPCDPLVYAVWYEHLSGVNPRLTRAIAEAQQQKPRLSGETLLSLYTQYVAPPNSDATAAATQQLSQVMDRVAKSATETSSSAGDYAERLASLGAALAQYPARTSVAPDGGGDVQTAGQEATALQPSLEAATAGTNAMQAMLASLQEVVKESRQQIAQLRQDLERTRVEAVTDALSGLLNRKGFDLELKAIAGVRAGIGRSHWVLMLDIDHFKRINDTYGHAVGDTVIASVGQVLKRLGAPTGAISARIGGEEFAVLMQDTTGQQALQLAEAVRTMVASTQLKKRATQTLLTNVTISGGVAALVPGDDVASWLSAADAALYRSKGNGRNRVTVA